MPLHKGAKPGTKGFKENIETEMRAGKPQKQAVAIAYSEARDVKVSKDAKGHLHVFVPGVAMGKTLSRDFAGALRTLARGHRNITVQNKDVTRLRKAKDMKPEEFAELERLLSKFLGEESQEPEHAADCAGGKTCSCGCKH